MKALTDNHTIFPNFNVVPNGGSFYNGIGSNVDMVAYFHWVVVEISAISLIWRPELIVKFDVEGRTRQAYLITQPSPTRQYLPKEITTACPGPVRLKSPRMIAPLEMTVLPPRMIF